MVPSLKPIRGEETLSVITNMDTPMIPELSAKADALRLRFFGGLKFQEIAGVLGIPEGTVKSRMARALSRLAGQSKLARAREMSHSCRTQDPVQAVEEQDT